METTTMLLSLYLVILCFVPTARVHGLGLGIDFDSTCACAKTFDEMKSKLGSSEMIPVCSGYTIDWNNGLVEDVSGIYVPRNTARFFSANCDGDEVPSAEPAVFYGENLFLTWTGQHLTFSNVKFLQSGAGGTFLKAKGIGTTVDVLGCAFEGSDAGRAIRNDYATVSVSSCSFHNHTFIPQGGAIYNNAGNMTIKNSTFSSNRAHVTSGIGATGGAIHNSAGHMLIKDSFFEDNTCTDGGAIYNDDGVIDIESSNFTGNAAGYSGGAIHNKDGAMAIESSTFTGNKGREESGGAIFLIGSTTPEFGFNTIYPFGNNTIKNTMFDSNTADVWGGAIYLKESKLEVSGSTFKANVAPSDGGGIFVLDSTLVVSDNDFFENKAAAIYLSNNALCKMQENRFTDNKSGGETIHVTKFSTSKVECPESNSFIPSQDELDLPASCDGTLSLTGAPTDAPTASPASTSSSLCNTIIENDTSLSEDVVCDCDANSGPLITLGKFSITLDMNGHTIGCMASSTKKATCISVDYFGSTVENGTVANCNVGIRLKGSIHTVTDVSVLSSEVGMVVKSFNSFLLHNTIDASEDASTGGIKIAANGAVIQGNTIPVADGYGINVLSGVGSTKILDNHITVSGEGVCFLDPGTSSKMEGNICND
eukprot:CAMPEP_0194030044 /NCGR_PEP_ID=MMETSP0009_2-20130614/3643_1 /TAXON_ID=210454 /ORGANISM="Grammatophora oceanica, Strain CCMP 410" /LENGTH=650 /DNA_ID=CAMNT_0038669903 /DNA_START=902 /DNA_END=2854 /DNA_ORIENTATION=-